MYSSKYYSYTYNNVIEYIDLLEASWQTAVKPNLYMVWYFSTLDQNYRSSLKLV